MRSLRAPPPLRPAQPDPSHTAEDSEVGSFWLRKTQKPVLAVLLVRRLPDGEPRLFRGANMEVSMPTGSLCAERNVIGTAYSNDPVREGHRLGGGVVGGGHCHRHCCRSCAPISRTVRRPSPLPPPPRRAQSLRRRDLRMIAVLSLPAPRRHAAPSSVHGHPYLCAVRG